MARSKKLTLSARWDALPSALRALPYIFVSGGLTAVAKSLTELEVNDVLLMGGINVAILGIEKLVKLLKDRIKK